MSADSTMSFYIKHWLSDQFQEICRVGNTIWSMRMKCICRKIRSRGSFEYVLEIIRYLSADNARVDITIDVRSGEKLLMPTLHGFLDKGQTVTRFVHLSFTSFDQSLPIHGYLRVRFRNKEAVTQTENRIFSIEDPSPQLGSDLLHVLDNPDTFSDATLVCGDTTLPVHRNILSARSPVFATMFKTQMQEGRDGIVRITDMEPDVLQAMLRYVYSGKTDHMTHLMAWDLMFGADKYQLEELKSRCVEQLKESMASNNVFRSLVYGDLHDKSLKVYAVEFICKCKDFSDLEKREEWQSLLKEHPALALEVTTTLVKYLQKK